MAAVPFPEEEGLVGWARGTRGGCAGGATAFDPPVMTQVDQWVGLGGRVVVVVATLRPPGSGPSTLVQVSECLERSPRGSFWAAIRLPLEPVDPSLREDVLAVGAYQ